MLILHIGNHKAGSSTIQYFLSKNAEVLERKNILYPQIGRGRNAHHGLTNELRGREGAEIGAWNRLIELERSDPAKKVVASSEGLGTLNSDQLQRIREKSAGMETLILIYIRELSGALPSRYNQLTKKGLNTLNFDEFFVRFSPRGDRLPQSVERWANVFGWENLRIRTLDPKNLAGGTLLDDVVSVLGLRMEDLGGADAAVGPRNVSLGWKPTELIRSLLLQASTDVDRSAKKTKRIRSDVGRLVRGSCLTATTELGLDAERAQYLTASQHAQCEKVWSERIEKLNQLIVGAKLPLPATSAPIAERPFLPCVASIPAEERVEIASRLSKAFLVAPDIGVGDQEDDDDDGDAVDRAKRNKRLRKKLTRMQLSEELRNRLVRAVIDPPPEPTPPAPLGKARRQSRQAAAELAGGRSTRPRQRKAASTPAQAP